jgi:hypothetical protein
VGELTFWKIISKYIVSDTVQGVGFEGSVLRGGCGARRLEGESRGWGSSLRVKGLQIVRAFREPSVLRVLGCRVSGCSIGFGVSDLRTW